MATFAFARRQMLWITFAFSCLCAFRGKDGRHLHEDGAMSMVQSLNQLSGAALAVVGLFGAGYAFKHLAAVIKAWRED
jgi:hypothetical protein